MIANIQTLLRLTHDFNVQIVNVKLKIHSAYSESVSWAELTIDARRVVALKRLNQF